MSESPAAKLASVAVILITKSSPTLSIKLSLIVGKSLIVTESESKASPLSSSLDAENCTA